MRSAVTARVPTGWKRRARALTARWPRVRWGNLRRLEPFCDDYGSTRGTPVDRVYIERFVAHHAEALHGRVLEVKEDAYASAVGGAAVSRVDVVDIEPGNRRATIIADLGQPHALPSDAYEAIVLTQTLQLIPHPEAVLRNLERALVAGGTALVTVPTVSVVNSAVNDLWRWSPQGFVVLLEQVVPALDADVVGRGNLLTSVGFLEGVAAEELPAWAFARDDPRYPMLVTARLRRPA